ncbi:hypothetical protein JCM33374_g5212 [Metschnikowia sp. JCM 33374]|nr:hypothetical protein JCM33374_g5212 [Metschnikowia sp. JCM 33374]
MRIDNFFGLMNIAADSNKLSLNDLLNGEYVSGAVAGKVTMPELLFSTDPPKPGESHKKTSHNLVIYSSDNANTLRGIRSLQLDSVNLDTCSRLYLECVFLHVGYPAQVNDLSTGEFAQFILGHKGLSPETVTTIASSCDDGKPKEMMKEISSTKK